MNKNKVKPKIGYGTAYCAELDMNFVFRIEGQSKYSQTTFDALARLRLKRLTKDLTDQDFEQIGQRMDEINHYVEGSFRRSEKLQEIISDLYGHTDQLMTA